MLKLRQGWIYLKSSLWFVPGLMIAAAIAIALLLISIDGRVNRAWLAGYPRLFGAGADGSRGMLTAIASSMLTVAALIYSLTISALAQTSSQYTPRILRNFMGDRANQIILGYFVSVFAYCLIVLRTIRGGDEGAFVPSFSVLMGLLLALGGIAVLIWFIHHIASSLQAMTIVQRVAEETLAAVEQLFPESLGEAAEEHGRAEVGMLPTAAAWQAIPAEATGYLQGVESEQLMALAQQHNLLIRIEHPIGEFVVKQTPLLSLAGSSNDTPDKKIIGQLTRLFSIGRHRTIEQDVGFGIRQLVDIALKALSPGVNDTTTALVCIDYLSAVLAELAGRRFPSLYRADGETVRVIAPAPSFTDYIARAFDQIRISGKGNVAVFERLLEAQATIARRTQNAGRRKVLADQMVLVMDFAQETLATAYEAQQVANRYAGIRSTGNACDDDQDFAR
jgi:uncharacterized membrane protein